MNLRTALLAGILALACTALRAEEFQMAIQGAACPQGQGFCDATTMAVNVTGDFNSLAGTASATFAGGIVQSFDLAAPLTNYTEVVGGHTLALDANSSLNISCIGFPIAPEAYVCSSSFGRVIQGGNESWMLALTQAQFQAFKDPLASILSIYPATECPNGGLDGFCQAPFGMVVGSVTFTPVPTPGLLSLFLAALVGLALSRRAKPSDSLPSPS